MGGLPIRAFGMMSIAGAVFKLESKRVETRLYEKTPKGWKHTSYRWNSDESETGIAPALAWLHANCGHCHNTNPNAGGAPLASLASLLLGARATPGAESIVNQMPLIASHMVDTAGPKLVDDWISALEPCP